MAKIAPKSKKDRLLIVLAVACLLAVAVMIVVLCLPGQTESAEFAPPPFEANAIAGVPELSEDSGYSVLYQEGMAYRVGLCGNVVLHGTDANVYLTNVAENNVWLKVRVLNADGEILGETGLLKPGEYVKSVNLNTALAQGAVIKLKIMGYEPQSFNSVGAILLNTTVSVSSAP